MSTYPALTEAEVARIAPMKNGKPDLYNHMPTRMISKAESEARGWTWFYLGDVCPHGHKAARYVSNPRQCIDCRRVDADLPTIGGRGTQEYTDHGKRDTYSQPTKRSGESALVVQSRPLEPDALEKKFLIAYAEHRDFDLAAASVKTDPAVFKGRASFSKVFSDALDKLEEKEGLSRTARLDEDFAWTEDKRKILIRVFINTGDMGIARNAIQVSNYHYQLELQNNGEFSAAVEEAMPLANRMIDEDAVRRARQGSDKLLDRVLTAKLPDEYGQKVRVDMNVTEKLSDDQLNTRFVQLCRTFQQLGGLNKLIPAAPVMDVEFSDAGSSSEDGGNGAHVGKGPPPQPQSNLDLL